MQFIRYQMTINKKILPLLLSFILIFMIGYFVKHISSNARPYSLPYTTLAESGSPDGMFKAFIVQENESTARYLAIQKKGGTPLIVNSDFIPRRGYHQPIFTMSWNKTGDEVTLEIDHDFGDNNLVYRFNTRTLKLSKDDSGI